MLSKLNVMFVLLLGGLLFMGCTRSKPMDREEVLNMAKTGEEREQKEIEFDEVSVHDPSVVKVEDTYYIFGSHLASAKSQDLMNFEQITRSVAGNKLFPDAKNTLEEALTWAQTDTFWAADVEQLDDGQFYFYYNACRGDSPLSAMGVAKSDNIEGPYEDLGIFLKSGMSGESNDGSPYNANHHPNVIDPHTFYDHTGKLWMVYGSYSGGIFILEMDSETGFPVKGQGYGQKLLGDYHARIEGPYILYSPDTEYYYLFLSYGGLDANGGYNIRVARSKTPDGPYLDSQGQDMIDAKGVEGQIFYDPAYAPYGHKLLGNFEFEHIQGEVGQKSHGYISPGHNSAYYEEEEDKYFILFHSRFPRKGEAHYVRVHQFFMNDEGWPVIAPYRYTGETLQTLEENDIVGAYKLVNHGRDISADVKEALVVGLLEDGQLTGDLEGKWTLEDDAKISITLGDLEYTGVALKQYDEYNKIDTMTFTVGANNGESLWGSQIYLVE